MEPLRRSGIEIIGDVPWGTHFCQFYQTKQDLLDILLPYFKAGLENNEFCMWVASEPLTAEEALEAFRQYLPGLESYRSKGQFEIIPHTDWYLKGGSFDSERVLNGWVERLDEARTRGFDGLRLTGNTFWLEKKDWRDFVAYEEEVNRVIGSYRMIAVCTYCADKCTAAEVIDVVSNHQFALSKRDGKWSLIENAEFRRTREITAAKEVADLYNNAPCGYHSIDQDGVFVRMNDTELKWLGYSRDEVIGKMRFSDILTPRSLKMFRATFERSKAAGWVNDLEFELVRKDGTVLPVLLSASAVRDEKGNFVMSRSTVYDVTERKKTEAAARLASAYNRSLIEASLDPLVTIDGDGRITDVNAATEAVTGCSRDELIGTDFSNYFAEPDRAKSGYLQVFREGTVKDYPLEIRHKDGRFTPVLYNASVYRDDSGKVIGVFAAARDISERRETERRIMVTNDLLKLYTRKFSHKEYLDVAVELIRAWSGCRHIGVRIADKYGNIPYEACVGYNPDFLQSENKLSLKRDQCICIRVIAGAPEFRELADMTPHGSFYSNDTSLFVKGLTVEQKTHYRSVCMKHGYTSLAVVPIRYRDKIIGAVHIADERPNMVPPRNVEFIEQLAFIIGEAIFRFGIEEQLRKLNWELERRVSERTAQLEAANRELEAFAYSVSHDLRAPLRSIDGFSNVILEDYAMVLDDAGKGYFERIRAAAGKMGQLIDALLNLSRLTRGELNRADVDLSALARSLADELYKSEPGRGMEFVIARGMSVKGDPVMLRAAIENLLSNAWKFTRTRETGRIECGSFECGRQNAEFGVKTKNRCEQGETVYFVRDNGAGFDSAYEGKLFSAFQRLHSSSEFPGLGIGLATVQRIIHRHGGRIWAEGEVGKGATFYFTLGPENV